jgi:2-keto-4-pentenoate hydratase/2-oxohepta-3-ene-1,7-dioic acid hydratase in catechol pathway
MAKAKKSAKKSKSNKKSKAKPAARKAAPKAVAAKSASRTVFNLPQTAIPVAGTDLVFPIRRIYCIGRNYAAHAIEMGSDPTREPPFFFQKPADAAQYVAPKTVGLHPYPTLTKNYHYEVEMVAALKSGGKNIKAKDALKHVYGYAVGIDMTRRDLQGQMKDQKKPWEIGKAFDKGAPIGPIFPVSKVGHPSKGTIQLLVNGEVKQKADLSQMIWSVAEQIEKLSEAFELKAGDIILSGTPENVGAVKKGDTMTARIKGFPDLTLKIV